MDNTLKVVGGVSLGAGLLLLLDPAGPRRRLGQARDRVRSLAGLGERLVERLPPEGPAPGDEGARARPDVWDREWTPAARLLAGAAGGGLALYGATRRGRIGAALGSLGLGLIVRGLTDAPLRRLAGRGVEEGVDEVRRAIHVGAPPAAVFAAWLDRDNFPRIFTRVREVRDIGEGRSRWVVDGPGGTPAEWDVALTRFETERELAWRTLGDPEKAQHLTVTFAPDAEGGTRVELRLLCSPPAGAGAEVATLFGVEPERQVDDDLVRMKAYVEATRPETDARAR
jgi:uncharacterized membrane protein